MPAVWLKAGKEKSVHNRHPWIFSGAIARQEQGIAPGAIVDVLQSDGVWLARGYINPHSQIAVRLLTWDAIEQIEPNFWERRLRHAIKRRDSLRASTGTNAYRLVHAEADGLPGLIVDRYADWLVLQSLTLGIEQWKPLLAELLLNITGCKGIYERSDAEVRSHEGLRFTNGLLKGGQPPAPVRVMENGHLFAVDVCHGHKTGFYLDQRDNRSVVAQYCGGAQVLNAFSYTGGFSIYALAAGAQNVTNIDSSADALRMIEVNTTLNELPAQTKVLEGDAFQVLRRLRDDALRYDVVILDPPKFAFSRAQLGTATRGYKDINMLGMQLLRPGGILATFSCSGLVDEDLFQKIVFGASIDAGREGRIMHRLGQGSDHPTLLSFPESAYLKGFIICVD
ncbi:MAG: class I SAM-dependent rRNA methyltransferase [Chloroflexi bacterium]|nr:class I SAM-dependent rRNA methyltransferase [Chloroflexota bacterium]